MTENIYSVSQVNLYIKNLFAKDRALNRVSVQGEVSNCKYHSSGHIYFTLKDAGGTLSAIMFASRRAGLGFMLRDGQQVVVTGSIEVYERGGSYQIYAQQIKQAGLGDLYERFLKLKEKLEDMGMFAPEYKQSIPKIAHTIGIATASTGAALQDIINVTKRRNPFVQLVFAPTKVQGQGAAESIVSSIKALDEYGVDVIIVGRGGGSLEDLWAFNEELVARAIFDCHTPIISAVGHETDFTIADYVADMRAPTPSAAAELATMDMLEFIRGIDTKAERLRRAERLLIQQKRMELRQLKLRIVNISPVNRLNTYRARSEEYRLRLANLMEDKVADRKHRVEQIKLRIPNAMNRKLTDSKHLLAVRAERLKGLSPLDKISSGYGWVSDESDRHVMKASEFNVGDVMRVRFADGKITAKVSEVEA